MTIEDMARSAVQRWGVDHVGKKKSVFPLISEQYYTYGRVRAMRECTGGGGMDSSRTDE